MISIVLYCISALIIALIFEWKTALTAIVFFPLLILSYALGVDNEKQESFQEKQIKDTSLNLIRQSIINIRTVLSSCSIRNISEIYHAILEKPSNKFIRKKMLTGCFLGFSYFLYAISYGILPYVSSIFVEQTGASLENMLISVYTITFATISIGQAFSFLPDIAKTKNSATALFLVLDEQDERQIEDRQNQKKLKTSLQGDIIFDNVSFKYANRNQKLFQNLNLRIKKGQKTALTGISGCGKSTIVEMIQRFYEPTSGNISINGNRIKQYDLSYLRESLGVVGQEPTLFEGSFLQNIKYNKNITENELRQAASMANALQFIEKGEQKTRAQRNPKQQKNQIEVEPRNVGIKGSHISGGEKQRVAIARALARKPKILLMDEATSALDYENETFIQNNIENAMKGKTIISIAHRFSTIENSDKIIVLKKGELAEEGTYKQLMQMRGYLYKIKKGQSL